MDRPPRTLVPAAALLTLALAGCAKDLELPALRTAPVLTSLTPARTWAGQLVRIQGSRLDPDPAANLVSFAGASARGLRFEGATLVVRVPDDAGSGPILVTNGQGTSDPFGAFEYLGLGEPRRRAVGTRRPILHRPLDVHGVGGETFLRSELYGGLLAAGDGAFASPPASRSAAAPWKGALFVLEEAGRETNLWRVDAATGAVTGPRPVPFALELSSQLVAMRGVDAVVLFANDGSGEALAAWDVDTLTTVIDPTPLADFSFFRGADVGDGRAVAVVFDFNTFAVTLALLDVAAAAGGSALAVEFLPGDLTDDLGLDPRLAVAFSDRFSPAGISTGEPLAAVTLASGDLVVARLGAPDPAFVGTVETFSPSAVGELAGAATLPVVLATKPDDGLSVGVDLVSHALLWSVAGSTPGPASATDDIALVAHLADNDVSLVNLATGSKVARVSFDVSPDNPGAGSFGESLAFLPRDPAVDATEDELYFPAGRFPGLLRFPLGGNGAASCFSRSAGIGVVAASATPPYVWAAREGPPAAVEVFAARGGAAVDVAIPAGGPPTRRAVSGPSLLLGHDAALSLLDGDTLAGTSPIAGALGFHGLGFTPEGVIWAVPQIGSEAIAQLWDPAQLGTDVPSLSASLGTGSISSAVWLEDGLWVFGLRVPPDQNPDRPVAGALLGPDLQPATYVALADGLPVVDAVSPNGRLFVERTVGGTAGETLLRFWRADPDAGFPLLDQIVVEGNVAGLAFDQSGERLWIVTRSPDRVVLVD